MEQINIQFSLFSAFYTPLISAISGGFLEAEGLQPDWSVSPPGVSAIESLENGSVQVVQSALSQGFSALAKGKTPTTSHFAQINEMDGFFLTAREADPDFSWQKLEGSEVVLFGGGQPLAMFKYACHKARIDYDKIQAIHVGGAADMDAAFRAGQGQFIQQQGPYPQQLETDGVGHIVAQVGKQIGLCGFSSLAASKDWLKSDMAQAFMRGYRRARLYINEASAAEIARAQKSFFPDIDELALVDCLETYKTLGCWTPHVEITKEAFDATQDIFDYNGSLQRRYAYEEICSLPPDVD